MTALWCAAVLASHAAAPSAQAQPRPQITAGSGLRVIVFSTLEGNVTAYLPDDVAAGEAFTGTLEGPGGFVLTLGGQRAKTGETFHWKAPSDAAAFVSVLLDRQGTESGRAALVVQSPSALESVFRFPRSSKPDGRSRFEEHSTAIPEQQR